MPRYQNKTLETFYLACLEAAANPASEFYHNGARRRGAGHRCAFWDGVDSISPSANVIPGTMSAAAYQAGKKWAKDIKSGDNIKEQSPSPVDVKAARDATGLSQTAAARVVHATCRAWQQWEAGDRAMHPAFWELFRIKTAVPVGGTPK